MVYFLGLSLKKQKTTQYANQVAQEAKESSLCKEA